ncbi:hypothetical protein [uncultured Lamprocystis sp.]|jgi:membrane-bound lytic murein transglycosylase MltF|uniref:hypothetical protein n=1 Tax=uncultured Lamprocystis sp. TaxID=543132 RepID=UPI0025E183DC|nr:hypothetical protein [uncultured Lamprocystis sp.]
MALDQSTVNFLEEAASYFRRQAAISLGFTKEERTAWADAIDSAITLNADLPDLLKQARSNGYQAALSHDCDSEEWGA